MNKQEERDHFWISVGPESGYLGTIAEETARKNDGGISPDGERLGWGKKDEVDDDIATRFPYGDPCDCGADCQCTTIPKEDCPCGDDCNCADAHTDCNCSKAHTKRDDNALHTSKEEIDFDWHDDDAKRTDECHNRTATQDNSASGGVMAGYAPIFGANCDCSVLPLPGLIPSEEMGVPPLVDRGPERQNTQE